MSSEVDKKTKKKKGIIRTSFVAPFLIFILVIVLFTTFFLDSLLKSGFEMVAEKIHGAEVNISDVDTSFSQLRMTITRIQVTDKENPEFNQYEIGKIEFALLWDAVLRAKAVINLAEVSDIRVATKRSYPGAVYPPGEKTDPVEDTLNNAKEEFDGNIFGDIASLLGGTSSSDVAKLIGDDLKSEKRFQEIDKELKAKEKEISDSLKKLPSDKELKGFEKRLSSIKWKDLGNILKARGVIKEVDDLKKDIEDAKKAYENANKSINSGFRSIDKSYKEAEKLIEEDVERLSKRAKLPTLDTQNIARVLFGKQIIAKVQEYRGYFNTAKDYIPKKKNETPAPVKRERGKGRDYQFGRQNSYPLFWVKKTKISSSNKQGEVQGEISDITTNQNQIGKPTTMRLKADFPPAEVRNVVADATLDMRNEAFLESKIIIGAHPVVKQKLSDSEDVQFIINKASNESTITSKLTQKRVDLKVKNRLTRIDYKTSADSETVSEILATVAKRTPLLTLDAKVQGKWDALGFDIKSNLASAIKSSVQALVQEKIDRAKKQLRDQVEGKVSEARSKVDSQLKKLKNRYKAEVKKGEEEFDKLKKKVDKEKKKASKDAEKSANDLLKNFKL